jgi:hypothetical protein
VIAGYNTAEMNKDVRAGTVVTGLNRVRMGLIEHFIEEVTLDELQKLSDNKATTFQSKTFDELMQYCNKVLLDLTELRNDTYQFWKKSRTILSVIGFDNKAYMTANFATDKNTYHISALADAMVDQIQDNERARKHLVLFWLAASNLLRMRAGMATIYYMLCENNFRVLKTEFGSAAAILNVFYNLVKDANSTWVRSPRQLVGAMANTLFFLMLFRVVSMNKGRILASASDFVADVEFVVTARSGSLDGVRSQFQLFNDHRANVAGYSRAHEDGAIGIKFFPLVSSNDRQKAKLIELQSMPADPDQFVVNLLVDRKSKVMD